MSSRMNPWYRQWMHAIESAIGIVIGTLHETYMKDTPTKRIHVQIVGYKNMANLQFPEFTEFKFQQIFWIFFPRKMMAAEERCLSSVGANLKAHDIQRKSRMSTGSQEREVADQFSAVNRFARESVLGIWQPPASQSGWLLDKNLDPSVEAAGHWGQHAVAW